MATVGLLLVGASCSHAPALKHVARSALRMSTASKPNVAGVEKATVEWDRDAWVSGYRTAPSEDSYSVECADLPADLVGTFFRNCPAKFDVAGDRVMHPFDADGMIAALTLEGNGKAHFRNRFVRTRGFVLEEMEAKRLYAGTFGNPKPVWAGGLEVRTARARHRSTRAHCDARHAAGAHALAHTDWNSPARPRSPPALCSCSRRTWRTPTCCGGAAASSRCGRAAGLT
jgi:hypothetical protein